VDEVNVAIDALSEKKLAERFDNADPDRWESAVAGIVLIAFNSCFLTSINCARTSRLL
jgi:hypothetical protein